MVPVLRGCDGGARRGSGNGAAAGAGRFLFAGLDDGYGSGDRCGGIAPTWGQSISTGVLDRCMRSGMVVVEERLITCPLVPSRWDRRIGIVGAQGPRWLPAPSKKSQVANLWEGGRRPGDMVELYRTGRDWPKADLALPI